MKIISLFNHKGGVSKTTTAFNLGWKLAELGHKTLIVDADPQCNLTALVLGYQKIDDIDKFYAENPGCDIYSCIKPVLDGSGKLVNGNPIQTSNPSLYLQCGNIELAEVETQTSVALTTSTAIPAIKNIPGSISHFIRDTAAAGDFQYVIIDMSPSVGALNECLLMGSDYFIVPTSPDFFCGQAVKSLAKTIPRWNAEVNPFRDKKLLYAFPDNPPKFIGFISQKYRPRNGYAAMSFQKWIDIIRSEVDGILVPALKPHNMSVDEIIFAQSVKADKPFNLANISDFNSLIAQSQKHNVPVFALTDAQIEQGGVILETMKENRDNFNTTFENLAKDIEELTIWV